MIKNNKDIYPFIHVNLIVKFIRGEIYSKQFKARFCFGEYNPRNH